MTLDFANEYPDVLSRKSEGDQPSGRASRKGTALTERGGKSIFVLGRASSADPVSDRRTDEMAECLCEDLPV